MNRSGKNGHSSTPCVGKLNYTDITEERDECEDDNFHEVDHEEYTKVVFKANKGFCDLQFGHTLAQDLYGRVKDHLTERMNVVQAGKSASVRIAVTPIWFENYFEEKLAEVDEALTALDELYELSKKLL